MIEVHQLLWDEWNVAHIARHKVLPDEVEEVCHGNPLVLGSYGGRYLVIGPTVDGRALTAVLEAEKESGTYYPITARPASTKEQRLWAEHKESKP